MLLKYVADQQEKIKKGGDDDGKEEEEDVKYVRKWYTPWKKTKIQTGGKKVSSQHPPWCPFLTFEI